MPEWREWSRLWRKSGRVYRDVSGIQARSGLLNGCRASHSRSELLLDLGEKDVYSSCTPGPGPEPQQLTFPAIENSFRNFVPVGCFLVSQSGQVGVLFRGLGIE